jgi:hypothetical protein
LAISNPTLPEITYGYEIQLHHSKGHDPPTALEAAPGERTFALAAACADIISPTGYLQK